MLIGDYKEMSKMYMLPHTQNYNWLPQDPLSLKIIQRRFELFQQPINVEHLKLFILEDLKNIYQVLTNANSSNYFEFSNQNCMIYQNTLTLSMELHTYCLNTQKSEKFINLPHKTPQILSLNEKTLALLTNSSVLVYDTSYKPAKISQKLATANPKQMALGTFKNNQFLAVFNNGQSDTLNHGFVEIYRSVNSSDFKLFQTLQCFQPVKIKFSYIESSNDFLIHILTGSFAKPYLIYQYQGVMGFQEVLSESILPANSENFYMLNQYSSNQYLVALIGRDEVTLMEIALKQII